MKKNVCFLIAICSTLLFSSCENELDDITDSLVGTKWVMSWDGAKEIIEFTSSTDVRIYEADANLNYSDYLKEGKYFYVDGQITFTDKNLFLTDIYGISICYYYYFEAGTINGDILNIEASGKKLVIHSLTTGEYSYTDVEGERFKFMKVK